MEAGPRIGGQKGPPRERLPPRPRAPRSRRRRGARGRGIVVRAGSGAVLEAPALVAGLDDLAVRAGSRSDETSGGRFRAERVSRSSRAVVILASPNTLGHSACGEVGGDDHRGPLVEPADQVEEELATGLGEGQIAQFVEDHEVEAAEEVGDPALAPVSPLGVELVHQIDDVEEAPSGAVADARADDARGEMRLAGARAADQDQVALLLEGEPRPPSVRGRWRAPPARSCTSVSLIGVSAKANSQVSSGRRASARSSSGT